LALQRLYLHRQKWDRFVILAGIVTRYVLLTVLCITAAITFELVDLQMALLLAAAAGIIVPFAAWWEYAIRLGRSRI
jgi:hypothetical protein